MMRATLAIFSGTLLFLSCASFDIWPLAWVGFLPLFIAMCGPTGMRLPFLLGWLCGVAANAGGFYWIPGFLVRFGHLSWPLAIALFTLQVSYQALTFAGAFWLTARIHRRSSLPITWVAPVCWVACELCFPQIFPFYLAITQAWQPLVIQIADITGPLGVSFLLLLANAAVFDLWRNQALRASISAAIVIVLCLGYGAIRIRQVTAQRAAAQKVKVGIVQGNIGIFQRMRPDAQSQSVESFVHLSQDLERRGSELIVWPEQAYPFTLSRTAPLHVQEGFSTPLLFGAETAETSLPSRHFNSALLTDGHGNLSGIVDKNLLMIFGEYVPFPALLGTWIPSKSSFTAGTSAIALPFSLHGRTFQLGVLICFEDIVPQFGRRLFRSPNAANLLVNITNDAWFGATTEPWQHFALSVFRAVEHRKDLVRAVNTGVSGFVDATGHVSSWSKPTDPDQTPGVKAVTLIEEAALMDGGTPYETVGEAFGWLCVLIVVLLLSPPAKRDV